MTDTIHSPGRRRRRRGRRLSWPAALALVAAGGVAACGSGTSSTAASAASQVAAGGAAASGAPVPLTLYEADNYAPAVAKGFTAKTGIPVKVVHEATGALLAKIQAEKNNPQWTMFWTDGAEPLQAMDGEGMLVKGFEPTSGTLTAVGSELVPADKSFVPTGATIAGAIVYNAKAVSAPPATWTDLLQPQWKGEVGMNNPAISGPTYPFVAGMMKMLGGVSQGERFFSQLKSNGLHVYQKNGPTLHALTSGEIKVAIVQNVAGIALAEQSPDIKVAYPSRVTLMPSVLGIDAAASAAQRKEAEEFASFVYSPQGQSLMQSGDPTGDSLFFPIIAGRKPLSGVPELSTLPTQTVSPVTWGPQESTIDSWFTNNIVS